MSDEDEKRASMQSLEYESCSWVTLLKALQEQEKTSRAWDNSFYQRMNHTICYFIQKRRGCWDFIPPFVMKPFSMTNICYLVEMISMLGLMWTEFDMRRSSLRAEGNGYMITSEHIPSLGIMIRFSRVSKPEHQENRIIPCIEVKRLCFGEVPSIFSSVPEIVQVSPNKLEISLKQILPRLASGHLCQFLEHGERPLMFPSKSLQDRNRGLAFPSILDIPSTCTTRLNTPAPYQIYFLLPPTLKINY
jgi:hypothetical protein